MDLVIVFLIGLAASFIGSFVSGGLSFITLPALLLLGVPAHTAIGTLWIGALGFNLGGLYQYAKNKQVIWSVVPLLTILSVASAIIGSSFILKLEEDLLVRIVGLVVLLLLPILFFAPKLGLEQKQVSKHSSFWGFIVYFLLIVYNASISVGYGLFAVVADMYFFGWTLLEAKATGKLPGLIAIVFALAVFQVHDVLNWQYGIVLAVGMLIGSHVGTDHAIRFGNKNL